jgi:hypothetical protein
MATSPDSVPVRARFTRAAPALWLTPLRLRCVSVVYVLVPGRWAAEDVFSATAARMSAFNASSSILSPSWKSMARLVLPSRLELKRPEGPSTRRPWRRSSSRHSCTSHRCRSFRRAPHRDSSPLLLLDHFGVGLFDESSDTGERLAPPINQLLDSRIYQLRGRVSSFSFLRSALPLLHGRLPRNGTIVF